MGKLRIELAAQKEVQDVMKRYLEIGAASITIVSIIAIFLQVMSYRSDARRSAEQSKRDDQLHDRYIRVLDDAAQTQRKMETLEEGGIKRAGDTLLLINNLLQITERAAAKAAGAQHDFLARSIATFDAQCETLVVEATKRDDRDIVAKPEFRERVRVLTKQIESLDNQITTYNESAPNEGATEELASSTNRPTRSWSRLSLSAPCLFIRGLNHHLEQNFSAALNDWKSCLEARNASAVAVDANYWIGYVNNTLGNFEEAPPYLKEAAKHASQQRQIELRRLEIETRLFNLDLERVPSFLVDEGVKFFEGLAPDRAAERQISTFATTMGNITLVRDIRDAIANSTEISKFPDADNWYQKALKVESRSRWARFGLCQNLAFAGHPLDEGQKREVRDVIGSVNREFQSRVEHRSKVLSKLTEYICVLMLQERDIEARDRLNQIASQIESLTSDVIARTIYSQFRKQNVSKQVFLEEFAYLGSTKDVRQTFLWANTKK